MLQNICFIKEAPGLNVCKPLSQEMGKSFGDAAGSGGTAHPGPTQKHTFLTNESGRGT